MPTPPPRRSLKRTQLNIKLPAELVEDVRACATALGMPQSELVAEALRAHPAISKAQLSRVQAAQSAQEKKPRS